MTTSIYDHYRELERNIDVIEISSKITYDSPVNFNESMSVPRHRWFPYKEGFSPSFVKAYLNEFNSGNNGNVFDPFSGVGTTALVAAENGISAFGFDVSPLAIFIAQTKSLNLSEDEILKFEEMLLTFENSSLEEKHEPPDNATVIKYYASEYLEALLRAKMFIKNVDTQQFHDLMKLALLSIIEEFSTHRKAGNGVKQKTRIKYGVTSLTPTEEVKQRLLTILREYAADLKNSAPIKTPAFFMTSCADTAAFHKTPKISALLTSPPYANCFDYSKIYMQELWLGDFFKTKEDQVKFRKDSLRSHVHATWEDRHTQLGLEIVDDHICNFLSAQKLWSKKIPNMLSGYFKDMGSLLVNVKPHMEKGAHLGFVVSNSFYGGLSVATDLLLAELGKKHGYSVVGIRIFRYMVPSSQQYKLVAEKKYMRESLVILRND